MAEALGLGLSLGLDGVDAARWSAVIGDCSERRSRQEASAACIHVVLYHEWGGGGLGSRERRKSVDYILLIS